MNPHVRPGGGPRTEIGRALAQGLPSLVGRLRARELDAMAARLADLSGDPAETDPEVLSRVDLLVNEGRRLVAARIRSREELIIFEQAVRRAANDPPTLRALLQQHLRTTRQGRDLKRDLAALDRWMDAEALVERYERQIEAQGVDLELLAWLLSDRDLGPAAVAWLRLLITDGRLPTRRVATRVLCRWAVREGHRSTLRAIPPEILQALLSIARNRQGDPLTARAAAPVFLVLPAEEREPLVMERLRPPAVDEGIDTGTPTLAPHLRDDFQVRAEIVRVVVGEGGDLADQVRDAALKDPSPTVRCALVDGLSRQGGAESLVQLDRLGTSRGDASRAVRTHARRTMNRMHGAPEDDIASSPATGRAPRREPLPEGGLGSRSVQQLAESLADLPVGRSRVVSLPAGAQTLQLARALTPHVERDHGYSLDPLRAGKVRVHRGDLSVLRIWRFLYEMRRPAPAKRQAGDHVSGRGAIGPIRVPPRHLAEVTATGVPGQRVLSQRWKGWAPWLPQVEDYLDALSCPRVALVAREGTTLIQAPSSPRARLRAAAIITWRMDRLDRGRATALDATDTVDRQRFILPFTRLGFTTTFTPSLEAPLHPEIPGYFPPPHAHRKKARSTGATGPIAGIALMDPLLGFVGDHMTRPYELAIFCGVLLFLFFGRLALALRRTRRARKDIPLVIGGWGTRGKSGTERLKAGVFEGLGYSVFSKTTGCEAMAMHTPPGGHAMEFFLYRPYDKATIWEHAHLLQMAAAIHSHVFLWECMALRDEYVEQLQRWWTRDDLSTITNAYPDHEDVQGPTGVHVAQTISSFMPDGCLALSTEVEMIPILRDRAAERGTALIETQEDEVDALPPDLLDRIPYREHPANVALAAAMSRTLGLDAEEAIILIADHVVPDLGALAVYPPVRHHGRVIEFSNGMSANDRAGFLNNWSRCAFDRWDPVADAGTFCATVVNNRRDRVPRSQVFARILVNDAPVHAHVLIGSNIEGLRTYIREALQERVGRIDLFAAGNQGVKGRIDALATYLRIPDPVALLRATWGNLGLPRADIQPLLQTLRRMMDQAPAQALDLVSAQSRLEALKAQIEGLAAKSAAVFMQDRTVVRERTVVFPFMNAPLFHDPEDREAGIRDLAEHLFHLISESYAFLCLARACHVEQAAPSGPRIDPPAFATPTVVEASWDGDSREMAEEDVIEVPPGGLGSPLANPDILEGLVSTHRPPYAASRPPDDPDAVNQAARDLFIACFNRRLHVVEDEAATGDQIITRVAHAAPAGARIRIMGIQNIKGTGLDFVYRWVHSRPPLQWAEALFHPDHNTRANALTRLQRWPEWSVPTCQEVSRALEAMPEDPGYTQARLDTMATVRKELERRKASLDKMTVKRERDRIRDFLWDIWDPFDSISRRWKSDRIWQDLADGRISHPRAVRELREVTLRQRGETVSEESELVP